MYAIVDIETTGSFAKNNGITEIAVILHNGIEVEGRYETLINPGVTIPRYVSYLTGITNSMVATAPTFSEVALNIFRLLNNRIFIAHNVNFDYTFIKHHFNSAGYDWSPKKLCTLKLSRKAFPGYHKYGLGSICRSLDIPIANRHRAGGDANATAILFEKILSQGGDKLIKDFLRRENHEQILPPNLPNEHINNLPYVPGVYYFHNSHGKVIYVGKAKCLKYRVLNHFTGLNTTKKRQDFLRTIHSVTFKECATEFTASIYESIEIKRLWPEHNISQKNYEHRYGIYFFEDAKGYYRLAIDKKRKYFEPIASFHLLTDAYRMMWRLVKEFDLDPILCFLDKTKNALEEYPEREIYNQNVLAAIGAMKLRMETYAIFEEASFTNESSCVLVENGKFYGMGLLPSHINFMDVEKIKPHLTIYPENENIRTMIRSYVQKNPKRVLTMRENAAAI